MSFKVLITGGTGLVGSAINSIRDNYSNYTFIFMSSKDCDLTDYSASYNYFTNIKPDYVIHLAACVGGLFKNINNKIDMFEKNMLINMNVLKICHIIKVKKLISCLSTCIFPDNTKYPINEKMLHNGPPHTSNDGYAYAKRMLEVQTRIYQEQYNDNFICIIPTNIYGPNDNYNLIDGHVIPSLIYKCYLAKKEEKPFVIAGTGKPLRQFVYSIDLAHLIIWVLEKYNNKENIILSVGEDCEVSINTIATEIAKQFSYTHNIVFDNSKPDGQYKKTADNTILMSLHNDFKFTSISDGIKKSVEWFIENYDQPDSHIRL